MWIPATIYKVKGGKAMRTWCIEGYTKPSKVGLPIIFTAPPIVEGSDVRVFTSSAVVKITTLPDGTGTLYHTHSGSEYLIELKKAEPTIKYRITDDPWIDLGGEG